MTDLAVALGLADLARFTNGRLHEQLVAALTPRL